MPDWQEILSRDGPVVWGTAYRLLGNRADADECCQEAFLAALQVSRRAPVQCWRALLQRLVTVRAVDRLRARRQAVPNQVADWDSVRSREPLPSRVVEDAELAEQLRLALSHIPPRQARVFCLHLEGWTYEEISSDLELSIHAVGMLLHRARKHLRKLLATYLGVRSRLGPGSDEFRRERP